MKGMKNVRETSIEAYRQIEQEGLLSKMRWLAYKTVFHHGPMTSAEACAALNQNDKSQAPSQLRARFTELRKMGVLKEVGKKPCSITRRKAILWDVTGNLPSENPESRKNGKSTLIAGLDEVGMGSLAGPIVVCVVAFDEDKTKIAGVKDSKKCTAANREKLIVRIVNEAAFVGMGYSSAKDIDKLGIPGAWQLAAKMALEHAPKFKQLIVDGDRPVAKHIGHQRCLPKADVIHWQVSAASIVAKVMRDAHMACLGGHYRGYGWGTNAGYGTEKHRDKILSSGATPLHRERFLRKLLAH